MSSALLCFSLLGSPSDLSLLRAHKPRGSSSYRNQTLPAAVHDYASYGTAVLGLYMVYPYG